ncbi:hypothetical protein Scep_005564 [Stephania cephalantha]|uniref:Uncharacterized protein n=1 Tax=Stephania cephalantha TaxID=152367 RepID=A0AAP0KVG8_9MAGN
MDNRWLTIHTVCLDLLESPEVREVKDMKMLGDSSLEGQTKGVGSTETTLKDLAVMSIPGSSYLVEDIKQDPMLKERDQCCHTGNSCENGELHTVYGAAPCSEATIKQFDSETTQGLEQTTKSWDESTSMQDDNLFSQHFSNLSADIKDAEEFKLKDQTSASEVTAVQKTVDECREALLSLDAAAERSLQLFSNLSSQISREEGADIYEKAVGVLPSVMEKLNALACVLQSDSRSEAASRTNVENCSFEPILEKFAESLSNKVLELVKKSM